MASGTRVHRKIQEASLGREEHKISGRKTKNRTRAKRSRRSFAEVSLDNADALIDAATSTRRASVETTSRDLPNLTTNRGRTHHGIPVLATKGLGKRRHVRRCGDRAQTGKWVRIRVQHEPLIFRPVIARPDLCVSEKESLLRRESSDQRRPLPCQFFLQCSIRDVQPSETRNTLSQHQISVLVQVALNRVALELLLHALSALIEVFLVLGSPPIVQVSLGVEFSSLIVEPVRHFMADYG